MRVKNKKTGKWVELPDPEPTPKEEREMAERQLKSAWTMGIHDNNPPKWRRETWERGY